MTNTAAALRAQLGHPVIDVDGHLQEMTPFFRDEMLERAREFGGAHLVDRIRSTPLSFDEDFLRRWFDVDEAERRSRWEPITAWWSMPTETTHRAMAYLPALLAEQLDVLGIDYSVLYPSMGLALPSLVDDELRRVACRVYNTLNAEMYLPHADRMTPVALIPMVTPDEAIDELDYAIGTLGLKAVVLDQVRRPITSVTKNNPDLARYAFRTDTFGIDSDYDYDPVWQRCCDLGVAVSFHSGDQGVYNRRSISRYTYNHIGCFGAAGESLCKSLFLGGVTHRFPDLNFSFLEGGVGWACTLLSDLIGHWHKRGEPGIRSLDPANLDIESIEELFVKYAPERYRRRLHEVGDVFARPQPAPAEHNDWSACPVTSAADIGQRFVDSFYFGCEADDPINAWAFNAAVNSGHKLRALFGSDLGHWDVSHAEDVLPEAYELVDRGLITTADFSDFVFNNPVSFYTRNNPHFFAGTRCASAVAVPVIL